MFTDLANHCCCGVLILLISLSRFEIIYSSAIAKAMYTLFYMEAVSRTDVGLLTLMYICICIYCCCFYVIK